MNVKSVSKETFLMFDANNPQISFVTTFPPFFKRRKSIRKSLLQKVMNSEEILLALESRN